MSTVSPIATVRRKAFSRQDRVDYGDAEVAQACQKALRVREQVKRSGSLTWEPTAASNSGCWIHCSAVVVDLHVAAA